MRALCDRRAGIGADGVLGSSGARSRWAPRRRRPGRSSGSWTTATPTAGSRRCAATASACSLRYLVEEGLVDPTGPVDIATRDGVKTLLFEGDLVTVDLGKAGCSPETKVSVGTIDLAGHPRRHGQPARRRVRRRRGRRWPARSDGPPEHDDAVYPDGVNVELVVRRGERHVAHARARAGLGRDPVVRHRRGRRSLRRDGDGRRGRPAGDVPRRRAWRRARRSPGPPTTTCCSPARRSSWPGGPPRSATPRPMLQPWTSREHLPRHRRRVGHRRRLCPPARRRSARRSSSPTCNAEKGEAVATRDRRRVRRGRRDRDRPDPGRRRPGRVELGTAARAGLLGRHRLGAAHRRQATASTTPPTTSTRSRRSSRSTWSAPSTPSASPPPR